MTTKQMTSAASLGLFNPDKAESAARWQRRKGGKPDKGKKS